MHHLSTYCLPHSIVKERGEGARNSPPPGSHQPVSFSPSMSKTYSPVVSLAQKEIEDGNNKIYEKITRELHSRSLQ